MSKPNAFSAMLRSKCPNCRQGDIFRGFMQMNRTCPVCGIQYEREHGYFLMAIFVGYLLNAILFAPIVLYYYFVGRLNVIVIPLIIAILVLAPFTFRYSRVVWMYLDEALDPRHLHEGDAMNRGANVASGEELSEQQDTVGLKEA